MAQLTIRYAKTLIHRKFFSIEKMFFNIRLKQSELKLKENQSRNFFGLIR
jgi:hypothetical protein